MKIGIDARMYRSGVAGIGRYSQNLIANLFKIDSDDQFVLFMTDEDAEEYQKLKIKNPSPGLVGLGPKNIKIVIANIPHYSIAEQTQLPKIIKKEKVDLMHFLNFNYPVRYRGKFIVTIHDLTLIKFPDTAKKTNVLKRSAFNFVMKKACQNATKVIAISKNTKRDIEDIFHIDANKIKVIYESADDKVFIDVKDSDIDKLKKQYNIDSPNCPLILYVGQYRPHKNLPGLVEAFDKIRNEMPCKLVLVGKPDLAHKRLQESIDKTGKKDDIVMPGFVGDNELACWYKLATVFAFPSLYEGFGLPGLEAMQAGTPVVAANNSVLPEIYEEAAIYFDPFETQDIADKIKSVLLNDKLRSDLIQKGRQRVKQFSWEKMARETLDLYRQIQD